MVYNNSTRGNIGQQRIQNDRPHLVVSIIHYHIAIKRIAAFVNLALPLGVACIQFLSQEGGK